jgi:hypothetical protein
MISVWSRIFQLRASFINLEINSQLILSSTAYSPGLCKTGDFPCQRRHKPVPDDTFAGILGRNTYPLQHMPGMMGDRTRLGRRKTVVPPSRKARESQFLQPARRYLKAGYDDEPENEPKERRCTDRSDVGEGTGSNTSFCISTNTLKIKPNVQQKLPLRYAGIS